MSIVRIAYTSIFSSNFYLIYNSQKRGNTNKYILFIVLKVINSTYNPVNNIPKIQRTTG